MLRKTLCVLCCFVGFFLNAQQEFHVFPMDHFQTPGTYVGNGSLTQPWDLQTALSQKVDVVDSGDTIWIHEGIYVGRFVSTLQSLESHKFITVSGFKDDNVILNGNFDSKREAVLEVKGQQVIFKNFEITWLGDFSRDENDEDFQVGGGIMHIGGQNCRFYNLRIHNNPGLGIGSWKHGAGTIIENCIIYNNGFLAKNGKGRGEGIYVQNKSDEVRLIKNNIIFNNYYKGIEVWSAGRNADYQFVKNITLESNIIFNSGIPSGKHRDNVIIASDDLNGINFANNITVVNNILYHNTMQDNGNLIGDAPSLSLGFNKSAPIEDVVVDSNIIIGGYNGLRLLLVKSLQFTNNTIYTGNVQIDPSISRYYKGWNFDHNIIYTKRKKPYRVTRVKDYSLKTWNSNFGLDKNSQIRPISKFNLDSILHITKSHDVNEYTLALFDIQGRNVIVDFSAYDIQTNIKYKIYDVENPKAVLKSGKLTKDKRVMFPMDNLSFEKPLHNLKAIKTLSNFGVFIIKFEKDFTSEISTDKKPSAIKRFFKWLGF